MWSAKGSKAALPSAATTPQFTLAGIGGEEGWHLYQSQVLQALGGCARQLFDLDFRYPRKATGDAARLPLLVVQASKDALRDELGPAWR